MLPGSHLAVQSWASARGPPWGSLCSQVPRQAASLSLVSLPWLMHSVGLKGCQEALGTQKGPGQPLQWTLRPYQGSGGQGCGCRWLQMRLLWSVLGQEPVSEAVLGTLPSDSARQKTLGEGGLGAGDTLGVPQLPSNLGDRQGQPSVLHAKSPDVSPPALSIPGPMGTDTLPRCPASPLPMLLRSLRVPVSR